LNCCGLPHAANVAPLSEHSNVAAGSLLNANAALVWLLSAGGPPSSVVSGGVKSTVHVCVSGSPLPPVAPCAKTANVCWPSLTPLYVLVPPLQTSWAPLSSLHWNVTPPVGLL
jgi:hypothetical protein